MTELERTLKELIKQEEIQQRLLDRAAIKAKRKMLAAAVMLGAERKTYAELLRAASLEMVDALRDIEEETNRDMQDIIDDETDTDAKAEAEKIRQAATEITDTDSGIGVVGSAILLPMAVLYAGTAAHATRHLKWVAGRGYDMAIKISGVTPSGIDRAAVIQQTVLNPWLDEEGYAEKIIKRMGKDKDKILQTIGQRMARGDKYEAIAQDVALGQTKTARKMMYRLIYTEGTHALNEASAQVFEAEDPDIEYIYSTVGDSRVCEVCQGLDGMRFALRDRQPGINFPPMHPGCRCSFEIAEGKGK